MPTVSTVKKARVLPIPTLDALDKRAIKDLGETRKIVLALMVETIRQDPGSPDEDLFTSKA